MLSILSVILVLVAVLLVVGKPREWLASRIKDASDAAVSSLLRSTSQFERDLTEEGKAERDMWRQQRLRYLRNRLRKDRGT